MCVACTRLLACRSGMEPGTTAACRLAPRRPDGSSGTPAWQPSINLVCCRLDVHGNHAHVWLVLELQIPQIQNAKESNVFTPSFFKTLL